MHEFQLTLDEAVYTGHWYFAGGKLTVVHPYGEASVSHDPELYDGDAVARVLLMELVESFRNAQLH